MAATFSESKSEELLCRSFQSSGNTRESRKCVAGAGLVQIEFSLSGEFGN